MAGPLEKLGAFYLGREFDAEQGQPLAEPVMYDARDLTTHGVCVGMTGSGKTGLCIDLLEEAALDAVPAIIIDPKGDITNLLLTFPELKPTDFEPWVNLDDARRKGMTPPEYAKEIAQTWRKGLADWDQGPDRIRRLQDSAEFRIYTPGSDTGHPVSILASLQAPALDWDDHQESLRERIQGTVSALLGLVGIDADPLRSREHILLCSLFEHFWRNSEDLDLARLITSLQNPPVRQLGVFDVDTFFPADDRFELAMSLNNILAAPGFASWLKGDPLDVARLLHTPDGKPRHSIFYIAHLSDEERMFFVTLLLEQILTWVRHQSGTTSLRALLYFDEVMGFLPPVANPPAKRPLLTLLKQARAFGLGVLLTTQNPVDLDYKGLSNTGTWFIGRLQTERDKARVMEGLEGASQGSFDKQQMERTLAGLGKRRFLLHNVHEDEPVVFGTRWVMSYLAGPLTRDHIRTLMADARTLPATTAAGAAKPKRNRSADAPALPPSIDQYFVPAAADDVTYFPRLVAGADLVFSNARYQVESERSILYTVEIEDGPVAVDWDGAEPLSMAIDALGDSGVPGASFSELPGPAASAKQYASWQREFKRWVRQNETVTLYRNKRFRLTSAPGESEGDFRVRLQDLASEQRDQEIAKLRKRYASKATTLENRLMRAEQAIAREQEQVSKKTLDTAVSIGTAILGAVLGRKRLSTTSASRVGSAIKTAGSARKEAADVARAKQTADKVRTELEALNAELEKEVAALDTAFDAQAEELEEIVVRAKATDVHIPMVALAWMPYAPDSKGRLRPAWG